MSVAKARAALEALDRAEQGVADAVQARDDAAAALDASLAALGWSRLRGAFSPGVTARYTSALYPDAALSRAQLFAILEQQAAAA